MHQDVVSLATSEVTIRYVVMSAPWIERCLVLCVLVALGIVSTFELNIKASITANYIFRHGNLSPRATNFVVVVVFLLFLVVIRFSIC